MNFSHAIPRSFRHPPRCVKTQLRRRVGSQWSKAHCPLHSLFYTYVYKLLLVKSKVTLVTLLRAYQDTALPECAIPHTKTSPRVPNSSYT